MTPVFDGDVMGQRVRVSAEHGPPFTWRVDRFAASEDPPRFVQVLDPNEEAELVIRALEKSAADATKGGAS